MTATLTRDERCVYLSIRFLRRRESERSIAPVRELQNARLEMAGANPTSQYRWQKRARIIEIRVQARDDVAGRCMPRRRCLRAARQSVTACTAVQLALHYQAATATAIGAVSTSGYFLHVLATLV